MNAKLVVVGGSATKREVTLRLPTIIGRSRDAMLTVVHPSVSRQHCELFERDGLLFVTDNGSLNGTFVCDTRVTEAVVRPGDTITIGPLTFKAVYEYAKPGSKPAAPKDSAGELGQTVIATGATLAETMELSAGTVNAAREQMTEEPVDLTSSVELDEHDLESGAMEEVAGAAADLGSLESADEFDLDDALKLDDPLDLESLEPAGDQTEAALGSTVAASDGLGDALTPISDPLDDLAPLDLDPLEDDATPLSAPRAEDMASDPTPLSVAPLVSVAKEDSGEWSFLDEEPKPVSSDADSLEFDDLDLSDSEPAPLLRDDLPAGDDFVLSQPEEPLALQEKAESSGSISEDEALDFLLMDEEPQAKAAPPAKAPAQQPPKGKSPPPPVPKAPAKGPAGKSPVKNDAPSDIEDLDFDMEELPGKDKDDSLMPVASDDEPKAKAKKDVKSDGDTLSEDELNDFLSGLE